MELLLLSGSGSDAIACRKVLSDFAVTTADSIWSATAKLQENAYDCTFINGSVEGREPLELLQIVQECSPSVPVVLAAKEMTAAVAVQAIRAGADHCFDGSESAEEVRGVLVAATTRERALHREQNSPPQSTEKWRESLVGDSESMEVVAEIIRLVSKRRCTVLIAGETGTGKEMAARAIHIASERRGPMVAVNCSALPENLLEAELFGHTKGAYTGATAARVGRFEQANRGTIFLDEIGDMPLELQAKLLRVLQEREIQRLGSGETIKIDVRVISATNLDLQERVRQGRFREDLYYRLNVVPLKMPPLRERIADIPALVEHFVQKTCANEGIRVKNVTPETMARLCSLPWPGNVRQLENAIEMAVVLSGDSVSLNIKHFGSHEAVLPRPALQEAAGMNLEIGESTDFYTAVSQFEFALVAGALRESGGNQKAAAARLGMARTTLILKMRTLESNGFTLRPYRSPLCTLPQQIAAA